LFVGEEPHVVALQPDATYGGRHTFVPAAHVITGVGAGPDGDIDVAWFPTYATLNWLPLLTVRLKINQSFDGASSLGNKSIKRMELTGTFERFL
jgi:hypothetical protein